jgi:hypothetical protein
MFLRPPLAKTMSNEKVVVRCLSLDADVLGSNGTGIAALNAVCVFRQGSQTGPCTPTGWAESADCVIHLSRSDSRKSRARRVAGSYTEHFS